MFLKLSYSSNDRKLFGELASTHCSLQVVSAMGGNPLLFEKLRSRFAKKAFLNIREAYLLYLKF